jgi:hypothetical protein
MSGLISYATDYARRLVRSGTPYGVAVRMAAEEYRVSTRSISAGLRARRRRPPHDQLPDRCRQVPTNAWWQD